MCVSLAARAPVWMILCLSRLPMLLKMRPHMSHGWMYLQADHMIRKLHITTWLSALYTKLPFDWSEQQLWQLYRRFILIYSIWCIIVSTVTAHSQVNSARLCDVLIMYIISLTEWQSDQHTISRSILRISVHMHVECVCVCVFTSAQQGQEAALCE